MGPTMDIQILRLLFTDCIEASKCLNIDSEFRNKLEVMVGKLPPTKIASMVKFRNGQRIMKKRI